MFFSLSHFKHPNDTSKLFFPRMASIFSQAQPLLTPLVQIFCLTQFLHMVFQLKRQPKQKNKIINIKTKRVFPSLSNKNLTYLHIQTTHSFLTSLCHQCMGYERSIILILTNFIQTTSFSNFSKDSNLYNSKLCNSIGVGYFSSSNACQTSNILYVVDC